MTAKNTIQVEGNGNIIIQGIKGNNITINTHNPNDIHTQLNQLADIDLDSLAQVVDKEQGKINELFKTLLSGILVQKNIVKGSISNVKGSVIIGDNNTINYIYTEPKKAKELTISLPKLQENKIVGRQEDLEDIYKRLFDNQQVVLVNGMGGIGKTTVAQVYLTKYYEQYNYIGWITLNASTTDAADNNIETDFINTTGLLQRFDINVEGKTVDELL